MNIEKVLLDFVNGIISYEEFMEWEKSNEKELEEYLLELLKDSKCLNNPNITSFITDETNCIIEGVDGIRHGFLKCGKRDKYSAQFIIHYTIRDLLKLKYSNITDYNKYEKDYSLFLDLVPQYVASNEGSKIIATQIFSKLEDSWTKKKKKEFVKEELKKIFPRVEGKYPHWVQESEWPVKNGKPMKYIRQKTIDDEVNYYFIDEETGELETIIQYW